MILSPMTTDQPMLKVLAGSHTQGPTDQDRDRDFRNVLLTPTADLFRPGFKYNCSAALSAASRVNH